MCVWKPWCAATQRYLIQSCVADTYLLTIADASPAQAPELLTEALHPPCYDNDIQEFEQRMNNTMTSMMTQLAALQACLDCTAMLALV